ncbi:hypothetical protein EC957_009930 [Mortierella hygrophila]|uniref:Uncharacterized protein n=1 Tax=Mortierella hygrophila TaxID=979708 RepID=A0A9P6EV55_9FUNG|nr:hypothetical protein EC957_009930 [Mortierella hygrophila]
MAIVRLVIFIPASALLKALVESGKDRAKRLNVDSLVADWYSERIEYTRTSVDLASDDIDDINTLLISNNCVSLMYPGRMDVYQRLHRHDDQLFILYSFFSDSFVAIVPTVAAHLCVGLVMAVGVVLTVVLKLMKNPKPWEKV